MAKTDQIENDILLYLQENKRKSFSVKQLSENLGYTSSQDFKSLVRTLAELEEKKKVVLNKTGQFRIKEQQNSLSGIFRSNDRGFGFVTYDPAEEDIFIPRGKTGSAMDGDTVEIKFTKEAQPWNELGAEGQVINILERKASSLVGEFFPYSATEREQRGYLGYVIPQDSKLNQFVVYILPEGVSPVEGSIVLVEIKTFPQKDTLEMEGYVTKEIGHKNAPGVDILTILYKFGIPSEFPPEVLKQAEAVPFGVSPEEVAKRRDLRQEKIVTIDGADAKDLDDAISLEKLENGHYRLGVHIADVSYYVTENSPLDREAYERGTSVYLTDRVVPMLPQKLSNGICSLLPDEERLTMTCEMEIDEKGNILRHDIYPSVIINKRRMTYDAVNKILMDRDRRTREEFSDFVSMFEDMAELHQILYRKRQSRGAIDFESEEAKIIVDEEGHPLDIYLRERGVGERLIESFMLAANETVAHHFDQKKLPFIYRVHEQPDADRMQKFMEFVTAFGIVVSGTSETVKPKQLQDVLAKVEDEPYKLVVSTTLLRSMKQAKYDSQPLGHYGLAAKDYTHFTSPIRRYPDLIVHRLIRSYQSQKITEELKEKWENQLPDIALQSSQMERRAVDAERETEALKKAEFMVDKIGQEFEGVVSSVTKFGIFVELPNTVEGLIHISRMKEDYFQFIESHLLLIGERTGVIYRIGQKVNVKVASVNVDTREIDFELLVDEERQVSASDIELGNSLKKLSRKGKRKLPADSSRGREKKAGKKEAFYSQPLKKKNKNSKNRRSKRK